MWKRLQQNKGVPKPISIGDPQLIETTLDESAYGLSPQESQGVGQTPQDGRLFGEVSQPQRALREPARGLPALPFQMAPQPYQAPHRQSKDVRRRPASSLYSQPSPNAHNQRFKEDELEISPPSSPDVKPYKSQNRQYSDTAAVSPNVSPIDEMPPIPDFSMSQSSSKPPPSSIPVMRREKRRNQIAAAAKNNQEATDTEIKADTRWDVLTGEPTKNGRGKPPQVRPGEFSVGDGRSDGDVERNFQGNLQAPKGQASFGERVRRLKDNAMGGNRPEWRGASGRTALVSPVKDEPELSVLNIPRKSSKRATSPRLEESGNTTPVSAVLYGSDASRAVPSQFPGQPSSSIRPIIPSDVGRNTGPYVASPTSTTPPVTKASPRGPPRGRLSVALDSHPTNYTAGPSGQPPRTSSQQGGYPTPPRANTYPTPSPEPQVQPKLPPSVSTIDRNFTEALKTINVPLNEPGSRFSVTTYATSAGNSTPRASMEEETPPMPPVPPQHTSPMITHRQTNTHSSQPTKATVRKPIGDPIVVSLTKPGYRSSVPNRTSSASTFKNLPLSPPENESINQITSLQAQIDNLARRRANLQRSIHQMTELMPHPTLKGTEGKRREEEKRKVGILRAELADVQIEEHELGIKLHRAWKREAAQEVYEPTSLWVRRVTE